MKWKLLLTELLVDVLGKLVSKWKAKSQEIDKEP